MSFLREVHLILSFSLGPLKEISSKKVMSISHGLKAYLLEVNSVGCSADHVAQLDLKGVGDLRLSFSKEWSRNSWLSISCSSTFSVRVMLCVFIGKLKAVLDLPLLGVPGCRAFLLAVLAAFTGSLKCLY